ncbi:MAG: helix-turn-helix transcriptional regulator [Staphylococcus epidermidis]|nr:helix-turn-helix transcriptional regulator [Staphylococcus epidermidis]
MRDRKHFSEQIRLWRKSRGLTKVEAAKIFGVTPEAICHWESGKAQPQDGDMFVICEKLNLDPHMFLRKKTNPSAEMLKRKRCEAGLTQSELAVKLGYRRDTIAKWETGSSISKCALEDICTFFGIEIPEGNGA